MSIKYLFLTATLAGSIALAEPVLAHGDESHGAASAPEPADHAQVGQPTLASGALASLQASVDAIDDQIAAGSLDAVHEEVEKAEAAIQAIQEQAAIDVDRKPRLEAALRQLSGQLDRLHSTADGKDIEKTEMELKKVEGALRLVENALK